MGDTGPDKVTARVLQHREPARLRGEGVRINAGSDDLTHGLEEGERRAVADENYIR